MENSIRGYILERQITLFRSKWHNIKKDSKTGYEYNDGIPGVALLPFRFGFNNYEFLVRKEYSPTQNYVYTLITGRSEKGEKEIYTASRELKEESGYKAPISRFVNLGGVYIGKADPVKDTFFVVDLSDIPRGKITTDGTDLEKMARNAWISEDKMKTLSANSEEVYIPTAYERFKKAREDGRVNPLSTVNPFAF